MRNNTLRFACCAMVAMIGWVTNTQAKFIMRPYLQAPTTSSVCVVSETDSKKPPIVIFWTENGSRDSASTKECESAGSNKKHNWIFKTEIGGLKSATRYYYCVRHGDEISPTAEFRTLPELGAIRFAVYGDFRNNPLMHGKICDAVLGEKPYFSIYTGDLCYNGTYNSWKEEFFVPKELELSSQIPFFNAVGNHEYQTKLVNTYTKAPACSSEDNLFYSFDAGDAHFLIINSETRVSRGSKQYEFIENDLKANKKKWIIAAFHTHAYCAGGHGENAKMKRLCSDLFEKYGVDVVFNGHTHLYQHNLVNGIHHVVTAGGGAPLYDPGSAEYVVKSVKSHHYCIIDIDGGKFTLTARTPYGEVIDKFELRK